MELYPTPDSHLAIDGGTPVRTRPLPVWPQFGPEETEAACAVLRSGKVNYWTGDEGRRFEEEFAHAVGCRYAVALANGTVALETALHAAGVGPGDEVVVTCRSFVASAACCVQRGAVPVFADVDPVSQNITVESVRAALSPRTRAVIAVHLAGWPCEMQAILALAQRHGLAVIEDCAQAHGATYRGRPVGSWGHVAAFSFCQDKILSTGGEGGMLVTNSSSIWEKAWSYKDHGKNRQVARQPKTSSVFQWLHDSIGTNGRLTEMQAAIGRVALAKLDEWTAIRRRHATLLHQHLARVPALRLTVPPPWVQHAYYRYYAFVCPEQLRPGWSRDRIADAIQAEGIPCGSGICPEIYLEQAFQRNTSWLPHRLPVAQRLGQTSLMLHVHPTLSEQDILHTCLAVEKVLRAASVEQELRARKAA